MSKKVNVRKGLIHQRREQTFLLRQSINDMIIPSYNAIKDPYLDGFFQHPGVVSNLRKTGIIHRKKQFSLQKYKDVVTDPKLLHSAEVVTKHRKSKSEAKKNQAEKLPQIEEQRIEARQWLKSEGEARAKKMYASMKRSRES